MSRRDYTPYFNPHLLFDSLLPGCSNNMVTSMEQQISNHHQVHPLDSLLLIHHMLTNHAAPRDLWWIKAEDLSIAACIMAIKAPFWKD